MFLVARLLCRVMLCRFSATGCWRLAGVEGLGYIHPAPTAVSVILNEEASKGT